MSVSGVQSVAGASVASTAKPALSWLRCEGENIVDEKNRPFVLRGINLGGYLVEEMWMMPFETTPPEIAQIPGAQIPGLEVPQPQFTQIKDHFSLWKTMESRFGNEETYKLFKEFRTSWLRDCDFEKIRAAGFNAVRLPFLCDQVEEPEGLFPWLDRVITQAEKNGLYVILDLHGTPGRQADEDHTGKEKSCRLFWEYHYVQKTCDLWTQIATRYKDNPVVAGYNLMNEPRGAQTSATLYLVQDRVYQAIRKVDTKHIIFMEDGYLGIENMPYPFVVGWENVAMSIHTYAFGKETEEECFKTFQDAALKCVDMRAKMRAPIYVGEFNVVSAGNAQTVHKVIALFEEKKISWSFWTFKMVTKNPGKTLWGIFHTHKDANKINPFLDSKEDILRKFKLLGTGSFAENKALIEVFQLNSVGVKPTIPEAPKALESRLQEAAAV